jgi:hypothetical protein
MHFRINGSIDDLSRALYCGQTACSMLHPQYPKAFHFFASLSNRFLDRYQILGYSSDYQLAIFHARRALELGPPDQRPDLLRNLANHMVMVAEYSGDLEILPSAVSLAREALDGAEESVNISCC